MDIIVALSMGYSSGSSRGSNGSARCDISYAD